MYDVSQTWTTLMANPLHWFEQSVVIGERGILINERGNRITFGGDGLLVSQGDADGGFKENWIFEMSISQRAFSDDSPSVGACLSAEIDLKILRPLGEIPRMALIAPYIRVTDGTTHSEWVPQGKFYIDTREYSQNDDNLPTVTLHGYDAMLMAEQAYPNTTHSWPYVDTSVVQEIADTMKVGVDPRTWAVMNHAYRISTPAGYSMREVLSNIGAAYCGNWICNYDGDLLLVSLNSYPPETNYIVNEQGYAITFGGDRILVGAV